MNIFKHIGYMLMGAMVILSSCNKEEMEILPEGNGDILKVVVEDGGYVSCAPLDSRTATDGFSTTFTNGDVIGVFAVVDGQVKQNNIGMIYSDDAKGWVGKLRKEEDENAKYFAYYPYQAQLKGDLNLKANDAEEFFRNVTTQWTLSSDQSTYQKYTAGDLMVGMGNLTGNSIKFTMQHQLGLVVIQMPVTKYKFTNSSPKLRDYTIPAEGTDFVDIQPVMLFDGNYRYLVKPGEKSTLSGSYIKDDAKRTFSTEINVAAGQYKKIIVDKGTVTEKQHLLQVGDYYMKDGSLIGNDTKLSDEDKKDCIGIVYWVGDATLTDPMLKSEHPNCMHGLVCALREGGVYSWQYKASDYNQTIQHWVAEHSYGFANMATSADEDDNMNKILGYNNTRGMEMFNESKENMSHSLQVMTKLKTFRDEYPCPDYTSGWFLPSVKEMFIMFNEDCEDIYHVTSNTGKLGTNMKILEAVWSEMGEEYADTFMTKDEGVVVSDDYYHTSSEHNPYKSWTVSCYKYFDEWWTQQWIYETNVGENDKGYQYYTRFVLAF